MKNDLKIQCENETHVLILETAAALEKATDLTPVKARGALVVKAAAPATRERAIASFIVELI